MSARFSPFTSLPLPKAQAPKPGWAQEAFRSTSCALPHPGRSSPGPRLGRRADGPIFGELSSPRPGWSRARRLGPYVRAVRAGVLPLGTLGATGLPARTPRATPPSAPGSQALGLARRPHAAATALPAAHRVKATPPLPLALSVDRRLPWPLLPFFL